MSEMDLLKLGFTMRGDGVMHAPNNSRVSLERMKGDFYQVKIALRTGNSIICMVRTEDVLVTRWAR
jgi:hypothetical protein